MINYPCVEAMTWCLALTLRRVDTICSALRALIRRRCFLLSGIFTHSISYFEHLYKCFLWTIILKTYEKIY